MPGSPSRRGERPIRSSTILPSGKGEVLLNVTGTRYVDLFERRDGEWRILERRNVTTWAQNTIEIPTPAPPFMAGSPRQRRPPPAAIAAPPGRS